MLFLFNSSNYPKRLGSTFLRHRFTGPVDIPEPVRFNDDNRRVVCFYVVLCA